MKTVLKSIGALGIFLSLVSTSYAMEPEQRPAKTYSISNKTTSHQFDSDLIAAFGTGAPYTRAYVFKSAVGDGGALDQIAPSFRTNGIEDLTLPFEALSSSAVQQCFGQPSSLRSLRLYGQENAIVPYTAISPLLQRSQLITLDFGNCILTPTDARLLAADLRQTTSLTSLSIRVRVEEANQLACVRALTDLGEALGANMSIKTLCMKDAKVDEGFIDAFTRRLGNNKTLESADLSYLEGISGRLNPDRVVGAFIKVLNENTTLKNVDLFAGGFALAKRAEELQHLASQKNVLVKALD